MEESGRQEQFILCRKDICEVWESGQNVSNNSKTCSERGQLPKAEHAVPPLGGHGTRQLCLFPFKVHMLKPDDQENDLLMMAVVSFIRMPQKAACPFYHRNTQQDAVCEPGREP